MISDIDDIDIGSTFESTVANYTKNSKMKKKKPSSKFEIPNSDSIAETKEKSTANTANTLAKRILIPIPTPTPFPIPIQTIKIKTKTKM